MDTLPLNYLNQDESSLIGPELSHCLNETQSSQSESTPPSLPLLSLPQDAQFGNTDISKSTVYL